MGSTIKILIQLSGICTDLIRLPEKRKTQINKNLWFLILRYLRYLLHACRHRKSPFEALIHSWNDQIRGEMRVFLLPRVGV